MRKWGNIEWGSRGIIAWGSRGIMIGGSGENIKWESREIVIGGKLGVCLRGNTAFNYQQYMENVKCTVLEGGLPTPLICQRL